MRLITNKKKAEIGKRLAAIMYISVHAYGKGVENDLDATSKIIEHVFEIAYAVGGFRFAKFDIPHYAKRLGERIGERKGGADDVCT